MNIKIARRFCLLFLVCVVSLVAQPQPQPPFQQPQGSVSPGIVFSWFSQDVPVTANTAPFYASLQAYWSTKSTQTLSNYIISGKWFVTLSLEDAHVPKIGQVIEVLIVNSVEGQPVSKL